MSSNSHPSATANKAIHCLKRGTGLGLQYQRKHRVILTKYEAVSLPVYKQKKKF